MQTLSCGIWDLAPWPGIKPSPPALGVRSFSHWTTREIACGFNRGLKCTKPAGWFLSLLVERHCVCACLVFQLCLTLCNPLDCSLSGSFVHGILQARILEWVAMPSSRWSYRWGSGGWERLRCLSEVTWLVHGRARTEPRSAQPQSLCSQPGMTFGPLTRSTSITWEPVKLQHAAPLGTENLCLSKP